LEALSGIVLSPGAAGLDARQAAGRLRPLARAGHCRLTSFSADGEALETSVPCAVDGPRLYVRVAQGSPHPERVWNEPRVRVGVGGEPLEASARIVSEAEEPAARAALAAGSGPLRRFRLRRLPAVADDELFLEIVPVR
jgi:hypothetical protein